MGVGSFNMNKSGSINCVVVGGLVDTCCDGGL